MTDKLALNEDEIKNCKLSECACGSLLTQNIAGAAIYLYPAVININGSYLL